MKSISVVIRSYNEAAHIGRLLAGIEQQTCTPDEVILVDSGSTDATVRIAQKFNAKIVTISPEEFTFGRSLNLGCQEAQGDILVFASAHVYPLYDNWLEALVEPFTDADIALSYGRQVGDHRTRFSEEQVFAKWFPAVSVERQDHPFCNNANAAIRRSVWQTMRFDEELTGLEDLHWAKRAMLAGHGISYKAEAAVAHVHQEKFAQTKNRYRREAIAHRQIFPEQRMSRWEAVRFATANIASDYVHAAAKQKLPHSFIDILRFRIAQFWGSFQGFEQRGPVAQTLLRHFYYPNGIVPSALPNSLAAGQPIKYEESSERYAA